MTIQGRARLALDLPVDLAREFDNDCKRRNITKTEAAITALRNFILSDELKSNYFEKLKGSPYGQRQVVFPSEATPARTTPIGGRRRTVTTRGTKTR